MGVNIPAAESLESPKEENEILWKKATDQTGFAYSGKNSFKSGEGEFTVVGQGDSFAKSHGYLLLTDVPGANANSGTTITAVNSEGKQAFVATETRTGGEQEVSAGAGTELKTLLSNSGSSDFLQLASPGKRKFNSGEVNAKWTASKKSATVEVSHGIGVKPKVVLTIEDTLGPTEAQLSPILIERTSTKFKFMVSCSEALTLEFPVAWMAFG